MKKIAVSLFVAALLACVQPVSAAVISPGSSVTPPPTVDAFFGGTLLAETMGSDSSADGALDTTVWAAVYRTDGGTLDFYYQVRNELTSSVTANRETEYDFGYGPWTLDVYQSPGTDASWDDTIFEVGTQEATQAEVQAGGTVGFLFRDLNTEVALLAPGEVSYIKIIRTDARAWTSGWTNTIDGGVTEVETYAPTSVPEPGSMLLLGTGLLGLAAAFRRRFKN